MLNVITYIHNPNFKRPFDLHWLYWIFKKCFEKPGNVISFSVTLGFSGWLNNSLSLNRCFCDQCEMYGTHLWVINDDIKQQFLCFLLPNGGIYDIFLFFSTCTAWMITGLRWQRGKMVQFVYNNKLLYERDCYHESLGLKTNQ